MHLKNSLSLEWARKNRRLWALDHACNPWFVPPMPKGEARKAYGDGCHKGICERLRAMYAGWIRQCVEIRAAFNGDFRPWTGPRRAIYERELAEDLKEAWYMKNLERLENVPEGEIEWVFK